MNFYKRYPGDYARDTAELTLIEHGVYTLLLDHCYSTEAALADDFVALCRICRAFTKPEQQAVRRVIDLYFPMGEDGLRRNARVERQLPDELRGKEQARQNGARGGRPKRSGDALANPAGSPMPPQAETGWVTQPVINPKPDGIAPPTPYPNKPQTSSSNTKLGDTPAPLPHGDTPAAATPAATTRRKAAKPSATSATSQGEAPLSDRPSDPAPPVNRPAQIAALLRRAEAAQGRSLRIASNDARLAAWAAAGLSDEQLLDAHAMARADRQANGDANPLNAGFLDVFVAKLLRSARQPSALQAPAAAGAVGGKPWFLSWSGIEAKAGELGLKQGTGEHPQSFRKRILAAAKVSPEAQRIATLDYGASP